MKSLLIKNLSSVLTPPVIPELRAHRARARSSADRPSRTTATLFHSGDGHNHWHVKDLEDYDLFRLDASGNVVEPAVVVEENKIGFCFFDHAKHGSSEPESYLGCEDGYPDDLRVTMGLSRGWGDTYGANTVGQYLDITDLAINSATHGWNLRGR